MWDEHEFVFVFDGHSESVPACELAAKEIIKAFLVQVDFHFISHLENRSFFSNVHFLTFLFLFPDLITIDLRASSDFS